jgi:hypothetical protein
MTTIAKNDRPLRHWPIERADWLEVTVGQNSSAFDPGVETMPAA